MKTLQLLAAAVFIAAAGSALAAVTDGQSDNDWLMHPERAQNTMGQTRVQTASPAPAPKPAPAASSDDKSSNGPRATRDSDQVMLP